MIAVDTNILIYSADSDEHVKGPRAVALLDESAEGVDAGVTRLYSEDVQSRPTIRGVTIVNPFAIESSG